MVIVLLRELCVFFERNIFLFGSFFLFYYLFDNLCIFICCLFCIEVLFIGFVGFVIVLFFFYVNGVKF